MKNKERISKLKENEYQKLFGVKKAPLKNAHNSAISKRRIYIEHSNRYITKI